MNKKEVSEIKKQFKISNNICGLNKILLSYVDSEKNVKFTTKKSILNLSETEILLYLEIFKKTLSGGIGKNLMEFAFPIVNSADSEEKTFLINLKDSKLEDDETNSLYVRKIAENFEFPGDYYICCLHCSYSIPVKSKDTDEDGDDSLDVYNFIITAICPIVKKDRDLCYDKDKNIIEKSYNSELEVSKPLHGFLFPAFNERATDIHSVLYYTANAKEPSTSIIETIFGCKIKLPSDVQKDKFNNLLGRVLGDDNTYNITSSIHSSINEIIKNNTMESDPVELTSTEIKNILKKSGVDDINLEEFDDIYEEEVGENVSLAAVNITNESSLRVDSPDIKISVKPNASDKVVAKMVDGKRCLVIALDDTVELNGLDVSIK